MKMKIWRTRAGDNITMSNNIVGALSDKPHLLAGIFSLIFDDNWRTAINPNQEGTAFGYEVWCIEIGGKMGWFRPSDNMPPMKIQPLAPPVPYNQKPVPVTYNIPQSKSSSSFLTRLFTFR